MAVVKALILIALFLLFVSTAGAIKIILNVTQKIEGSLLISNVSVNKVATFTSYWENIGSIGCKARERIEFLNESLVYTAWSNQQSLWPGATGVLTSHVYLPEGNYSYRRYIHHCYLIFDGGSGFINFSKVITEPKIEILSAKTFENQINLKIKALENLKDIAIIPVNYPFGWIFESTKIDEMKNGETKEVEIHYEPSIWQEEDVTIMAITMDGKAGDEITFKLKIEKNFIEKILDFLLNFFKLK